MTWTTEQLEEYTRETLEFTREVGEQENLPAPRSRTPFEIIRADGSIRGERLA
jgi:hypothetical protein